MADENRLTPEQKAHIKNKIRRFLEATHSKDKPVELFKRALIWSINAYSVIQMIEISSKGVSGKFQSVAKYIELKNLQEEHEAGEHEKNPLNKCPDCIREAAEETPS